MTRMKTMLCELNLAVLLLTSSAGIALADDPQYLVDDNALAVMSIRFRDMQEQVIEQGLLGGKSVKSSIRTHLGLPEGTEEIYAVAEQIADETNHVTVSMTEPLCFTVAAYGSYERLDAARLAKMMVDSSAADKFTHKVFGKYDVVSGGQEGSRIVLVIGDDAMCFRINVGGDVTAQIVELCGRMDARRPPLVNADVAAALKTEQLAKNVVAYGCAAPPNGLGLFCTQLSFADDVLEGLMVSTYKSTSEAQKAEEEMASASRHTANEVDNTLQSKALRKCFKEADIERSGQILTVRAKLSLKQLSEELWDVMRRAQKMGPGDQ